MDWAGKFRTLLQNLNRPALTIAEKTGVGDFEVYKVVDGDYIPSFLLLLEIVHFFHVNPDWLILDDSQSPVMTDSDRRRDEEKAILERVLLAKGSGSDDDFAQKTGVSFSTFQKIKYSTSKHLSDQTIEKIAEAYNVGFDWLLCGDEKAKDYPMKQKMIKALWRNVSLREDVWKEMAGEMPEMIDPDQFSTRNKIDQKLMGDRMRFCRISRGLSLGRLADQSFISTRTITRWENGHVKPGPLG